MFMKDKKNVLSNICQQSQQVKSAMNMFCLKIIKIRKKKKDLFWNLTKIKKIMI